MRPPQTFKTRMGKRLRRARLQQGLAVKEVSRMTGMNHTYLYDLEAGRMQPSAYHLMLLSDLYGELIDSLVKG